MIIHKTHKAHLSITIDARAVRTRRALREAMLTLLESRRFEGLTIGDLAQAAEVGYSTVCRHYPTLGALLDEIAASEVNHIVTQAFPSFHVTDTHSASLALFNYVHQRRVVWRALLTGGAASALRREFIQLAMKIARVWKESDIWLPPELGVTMTISGTIELMTWWLREPEPLPPARIAEIFERLLVAPLLGGPGVGGVARKPESPPRTKSRRK